MNSKKQIIMMGTMLLVIFSILFFNIRADFSKSQKLTISEINGINEITDIYKLDMILKNIRGISQLNSEDIESLKDNLFINEEDILTDIKKLKDEKITNFYNDITINKDKFSKMDIYKKYTKLLKLLNNKRLDKADSSKLLFEADRNIYFLMTTTVLDIPQIIEHIGKVRALGVGLLDNNNNNNSFLLKTNLKSFIDKIEHIKYTIRKLNSNDENRLNSLLDLIVSDFYTLKILTTNIENKTAKLNSKEYFLEVSKLVNRIGNLFATSKEILTHKLKTRKSELENKLLVSKLLYALLMLMIFFSTFYSYRKSEKEMKLAAIKKEQRNFMQELQEEYTKDTNLKRILTKSLNHLINHFNAINGSSYLFNSENEKLYLGATYAIKYDSLSHTLDLHENSISENILEKSIKVIDINERVNIGSIETNATKLVTIPILEFDRSIGTMQLLFDDSFSKVDLEFLQSVVSFMGTYINKAQIDEETDRYLKLIDKNVLISKTDLQGNIIEVSEQLCILSQYSKEELLSGVTHRIFRHKDMSKEIFVDVWRTITKGNTWHGEIKNRKKDGSFYWVFSHISPEFDMNGNIMGYNALRTDITDKKKVEEIAITDGLTSLYNRRHFDNIFAQQIEINKRAKKLLAFLLIDIDHFKQYNDTYGHQEGDTTLKLVAKSLKGTLNRPDDYTFRLGGEEFGLVYHIENNENAISIANKARENIENLKIKHTGNSASEYVTISSGLYVVDEKNSSNIDEIYKLADEALYKAKQGGRNQVNVVNKK